MTDREEFEIAVEACILETQCMLEYDEFTTRDIARFMWQAATLAQQKKVESLEIQVHVLREALQKYSDGIGIVTVFESFDEGIKIKYDSSFAEQALANTPNVSEWVGLSYEQKGYIRYHHPTDLVNATEAKLRELNTKG